MKDLGGSKYGNTVVEWMGSKHLVGKLTYRPR